jgi:hypothetical protein
MSSLTQHLPIGGGDFGLIGGKEGIKTNGEGGEGPFITN